MEIQQFIDNAAEVKTSKVKAGQIKAVQAKSYQVKGTPVTPKTKQGKKGGKSTKVEKNTTELKVKKNLRKRSYVSSTQQVIISLITIKRFKYLSYLF